MKDREFEQQMEDHKTKSKQPNLLDEKGFVFISAKQRPHWICLWEGEPWMFRWLDTQNKWISFQPVNQIDVWEFNEIAIPDEQAEVYHQLHRKNLPSIHN